MVCEADLLRIQPLPHTTLDVELFGFLSSTPFLRSQLGGSYAEYRLVDALRHVSSPVVCLDDAKWDDCVNSFTLPLHITRSVSNASFLSDIAMIKDPVTRLVSKNLPSRCSSRKGGTVAEEFLLPTPAQTARYHAILADWRHKAEQDPPVHKKDARDKKFVLLYDKIAPRRKQIQQIMLCSLLGNYPHCTSHVTHHEARRLLYMAFTKQTRAALVWFQSLLHCKGGAEESSVGGAPLYVWCMREFLVHSIQDNGALREQVGDIIHFESFKALVSETMGHIRLYMDQNLPHHWSSLGQSVAFVDSDTRLVSDASLPMCVCLSKGCNRPCLFKSIPWHEDMARMLEPFRASMLAVQYHKPKIDAVAWLVSSDMRKAAPLIPRRLSQEEKDAAEAAKITYDPVQEEEEDDLSAMLIDQLGRIDGRKVSTFHMDLERLKSAHQQSQQAKREARKAVERDIAVINNVLLFLTKVQFDALETLVTELGSLPAVVESWREIDFGVSPKAIDFILYLLESHRTSNTAKLVQCRRLVQLHRREPHAYNLLQVTAELLKQRGPDGNGGRIVGRLSAETIEAQIEACGRKMLGMLQHLQKSKMVQIRKFRKDHSVVLKEADIADALKECQDEMDRIEAVWRAQGGARTVEQTSTSLHFCAVCQTVYSNVRSADGPKFYRYGLLKPLRQFDGQPGAATYCRKNIVNHRGQCHNQLLSQVNLLGIVYAFNKKVYQLCVQCGDILSPDPTSSMCDKGVLCCACGKEQQRQRDLQDPTLTLVRDLDRKCVCCGVLTTAATSTFLFPFGVCLCRHHTSKFIVREIEKGVPWKSKKEVQDFIIDKYVRHKQRKREAAQPQANRKMKANRQRDRSKRA